LQSLQYYKPPRAFPLRIAWRKDDWEVSRANRKIAAELLLNKHEGNQEALGFLVLASSMVSHSGADQRARIAITQERVAWY
jgi:hypothetical protein